MHLWVLPARFEFQAKDLIVFAPGKASNTFRGAFGVIFRRLVCEPGCPGAKNCTKAATCPYASTFEPVARGGKPAGFRDLPRPFVMRTAVLDGQRLEPGQRFFVDVHNFDPSRPVLQYFAQTFEEFSKTGLGPKRGKARLTDVKQGHALSLSLDAGDREIHSVKIRFITPTELKTEGEAIREPRFDVLYARARDRISSLLAFYQGGSPDLDFRGSRERARIVNLREATTSIRFTERRSSRSGQFHPLAGFIGEAFYEGSITEFLPFLKAAYWTGVGRHTVWDMAPSKSRRKRSIDEQRFSAAEQQKETIGRPHMSNSGMQ